MKKTTCFISLAIAALFVSCSSTTDDASISLSVPRELTQTVLKNSDGTDAQNYPVQILECTLKDSSNKEIDSESVELNGEKNTVITFSEIPAGTEVSVSVTIYGSLTESKNEPKYRLYAGESDKITVKPGNNTITLKLEKTKDIAEISIDGIESISLDVSYTDNNGTKSISEGERLTISAQMMLTAQLSNLPDSLKDEITVTWLLNGKEQSAQEGNPFTLLITVNSNIQPEENSLIAKITYGSQIITRTQSFTLAE